MLWQWLKYCKTQHKRFFYFAIIIGCLYSAQLLLKFEITPLGYFSLYSNYTPHEAYYEQILPFDAEGKPINIYASSGTKFILAEILPTRYALIKNSPNGQPNSQRLMQLGLPHHNESICLQQFPKWYRQWLIANGYLTLSDSLFICGFSQGQLIHKRYVE